MRFIICFWSKKGCCTDKKYPASNSNEVFQNQLNDISYKDWASFANKIFCPRVYLNEILYSAAKIKNIIQIIQYATTNGIWCPIIQVQEFIRYSPTQTILVWHMYRNSGSHFF